MNSPAVSEARVVIIGGGISGLSSAYYLGKQGVRSVLLEKENRLGGLIRTDHVDGCVLEGGPDSFIASKPWLLELAAELGLADKLLDSNDAGRRVFIGHKSKLVPMPQGMVMMAPADLKVAFRSPFFSLRTKLRFAQELRAKPRQREEDVSLGEFVVEHFGSEVLETIAEPLMTGVYGGDPSGLSIKSVLPRFLDYERQYGSVIRGVQQERQQRKAGASLFRSFQGGMQQLTDALRAAIGEMTEVLHEEALSIKPSLPGADGRWTIASPGQTFACDNVVVAVPAHTGARLLATANEPLARLLSDIPYSSAILVTQVFDRQTLGHPLDGFGFLIPKGERHTTAAATWISTKFPSRTPTAVAAIRSFIVGEQAIQLQQAPDADIVQRVDEDLRRWMAVQNEPKFSIISRWPQSMPQYVVGHSERISRINQVIQTSPGLYLCGNAYDGVGIPDCVRRAKSVAADVTSAKQPFNPNKLSSGITVGLPNLGC